MRYVKMHETFWTGETGRKIRALGLEAQVVAHYLINNRHANMTGLYLLPLMYISADTGIPIEAPSKPLRSPFNGVNDTLRSLCEAGFCSYDYDTETIFVHEMAKYQIGDYLRENDKRVKGIENILLEHSKCPLLNNFLDRYGDAYCLHGISPFEAPSKPLGKPLRSQTTVTDNSNRNRQQITKEKITPHSPKGDVSLPKNKKSTPISVAKEIAGDGKLLDAFLDFHEMRKHMKSPMTIRAVQLLFNRLDSLAKTELEKIGLLEEATMNSWKSVYPKRKQKNNNGFVVLENGQEVSEVTAHNIQVMQKMDEDKKNGKKGIFDGYF